MMGETIGPALNNIAPSPTLYALLSPPAGNRVVGIYLYYRFVLPTGGCCCRRYIVYDGKSSSAGFSFLRVRALVCVCMTCEVASELRVYVCELCR